MKETRKKNKSSSRRILGLHTAILLVIANMIGTGLFTTTGFLIRDMHHPLTVLISWLMGGIIALCGALTYGKLGADMPRSGGEYHYLSELFHPVAGFLAGWVSLIVGFSAPIAAVAVAFSRYLAGVIPDLPVMEVAISAVFIFSILHIWSVSAGAKVQNIITALKIILIVIFVSAGFLIQEEKAWTLSTQEFEIKSIFSSAYAAGLIFVMYAYSGWNAATYVAGEIKKPAKNLPFALVAGTVIVIIVYLTVNYFFLSSVPAAEIEGKVETAHFVAVKVFGENAGKFFSLAVALFLLSSLSSMIMAGPRVYKVMGEDFKLFNILSVTSKGGAPYAAIILQMAISVFMILTFTFETILVYVGFTLSLISGLTVAGIFIHQQRADRSLSNYKIPLFPITPVIFLLGMSWMVVHSLIQKPLASVAGLITLLIGFVIYRISSKK
ncbi:MAG: amino acid permease [Bacteroidales bacterium]|nr:amino acid permease [Bacteroidales bacterium]